MSEQTKVAYAIERYVMKNKTGVIISPSYGSGWSTAYDPKYTEFLCTSKDLVRALFHKNRELVNDIAETYLDNHHEPFITRRTDLEIVWVKVGTLFQIREYDGAESVVTLSEMEFLRA